MMFKLTKEVAPTPAHKIEVEAQLPLYLRVDPQFDYEDTNYYRFYADSSNRVYFDRCGVDRFGRVTFSGNRAINTIPAGAVEISSNEYHDDALNKVINAIYETTEAVCADLVVKNFQPSN